MLAKGSTPIFTKSALMLAFLKNTENISISVYLTTYSSASRFQHIGIKHAMPRSLEHRLAFVTGCISWHLTSLNNEIPFVLAPHPISD